MSQPNEPQVISSTASYDDLIGLLQRMRDDPDFQAQISDDPVGTLAGYGIELSPNVIAPGAELPTLEEIETLIEELELRAAGQRRSLGQFHVLRALGL
jgi:hypothetical protein